MEWGGTEKPLITDHSSQEGVQVGELATVGDLEDLTKNKQTKGCIDRI